MLQRLISVISCLAIADALIATQLVWANVPVVQPGTAAAIAPNNPSSLDTFSFPQDTLEELELPASERPNGRPLYIEEQPLRLEIQLKRRQVILYRGNQKVKSYSIAIGKPGWETPTGKFEVEQMFRNPTWIHPLKPGVSIPGGDPDNPLGRYWIGFWTDGKNWIGFHGTPNPRSVGMAASHGCIRMYNKDIEELFQKVSLGTEVTVVQ